MKNINKTHLNFILLILLFLLTSCSKKVNKDYFLGDRFFYYTEDKLNIYKDLEIDKEPKMEKISNTACIKKYDKDIKDIEISGDGRFIYYIRYKKGSDNSRELVREDLYFEKISELKAKQKTKTDEMIDIKTKIISGDVNSFDKIYSDRVVYYNVKKNTLYIWNGEKSIAIAKDVAEYNIDYYENTVLYTIKNNDGYDLYTYPLNIEGGGAEKLAEGIDKLVGTSKTFDKIYYTQKESNQESLYCIRYIKDVNKISEGEFIDYSVNQETGNIYFIKSEGISQYGTLYYYDSSEKEITKVLETAYINNIIEGKDRNDILFIKTKDRNYLAKSGYLLEFKESDNVEYIYAREEDMTLFYLSKDESGKNYNLYSVSPQGEYLQEPELIDTDVESVDNLYYGDIYYYKVGNKGKDLYMSGRKLRTDVQKTFYLYGSVCMACKEKEEGFTLYRLLNGKLQLVGRNMHSFKLLNRAYIAYIKDFKKSDGDLYLWTGEYTIHLTDGVEAIGNEFSLSRDVYEKEH